MPKSYQRRSACTLVLFTSTAGRTRQRPRTLRQISQRPRRLRPCRSGPASARCRCERPLRIASSTSFSFGASSSRFGPTRATAFAAFSVWQSPQRRPNSSCPCFSSSVRFVILRVRDVVVVLVRRDHPRRHRDAEHEQATKNSERREPPAAPRLRVHHAGRVRRGRRLIATTSVAEAERRRRPGRRRACPRARNVPAQRVATRVPPTSRSRRSVRPARREALDRRRNLPELAQRRGRFAPALRALAAARRRRRDPPLGQLDDIRLHVVRRHQRPHRLDEHVDPAARLRQLLQPPLAQQQRLRPHRQPVRLIQVRRHDQVDRPELVLEQQEHDPLRRARPLPRDHQPAEPHRRVVRHPLQVARSTPCSAAASAAAASSDAARA